MATDSYIDLINDLLLSQLAGQNKSGKKRSSKTRTDNENATRGNMLLTKHEIIENRTSGDFSRELQKTETYELRAREVRVR